MSEFLLEVIGWLGCLFILLAYYFLSQKKWLADSSMYNFFNFFGASCVMINALAHRAWPIVGLEAVWAIIGLKGWLEARKSHAR